MPDTVATMKAVVFDRYGGPEVLQLKDVPKPVPKEDEVLIRVGAASINDWDWGALHGFPLVNRLLFGLFAPKKQILGSDVAGRIEAAGARVQHLRPGDEVFGDLSGRWGGFAEYVCAREEDLALMCPGMSFEQAAAIPQAAMLAIQGLRDAGGIEAGQRILINGGGGGVGTFAIQIARLKGAEIVGVDQGDKLELLRTLGAGQTIDYQLEDPTRIGQPCDLILDVKTGRSILDWARALRPGGAYVTVGGSMPRLFQALLLVPWLLLRRRHFRLVVLKRNRDLGLMKELFQTGKVLPVIDGPYSLGELPRAFRHFGEGRHKGKVVIRIAPA